MWRDFTYIDDVVAAVVKLLHLLPKPSRSKRQNSSAAYLLYNIGNNQPEQLLELVAILERLLKKKAKLELLPMQQGDVPITYVNVDELAKAIHYRHKPNWKRD